MTTVDMHVHSNFCDGRSKPREIVLSAIDKGIKKLGIVAHSYLEFEPMYCLLPENKDKFLISHMLRGHLYKYLLPENYYLS